MALKRMSQVPIVSDHPTSLPAPGSMVELRGGILDGTLEEAYQLRLSFGAGWDPYEVWCTRVRAQWSGAADVVTLQVPVVRRGVHGAKERASRVGGGSSPSIPVLAWPVLMLAVVLGLNRELLGIFRVDVVGLAFGVMTPAARAVHILLGISVICTVVVVLRLAAGRGRAGLPGAAASPPD